MSKADKAKADKEIKRLTALYPELALLLKSDTIGRYILLFSLEG